MLSLEAINKILGIKESVPISAEEMADKMNITFYPFDKTKISKNVVNFVDMLEKAFTELKVNVAPFEKSLKKVGLTKALSKSVTILLGNIYIFFKNLTDKENILPYIDLAVIPNLLFKRKRVRPGISIIAIGENDTDNLPMDRTLSFRESSVITILDMPDNINESSGFHEHFDTAMNLFAYHMTNIVIGVSNKNWVVYNFNASHPFYNLKKDEFKKNILNALIPKIVAPIRPHRFSDFTISDEHFDIRDEKMVNIVDEFVGGGKLFEETKLYPPGKKIDELPFRNDFYRWIGKIHLDNRNGMSYGFLAWQMPTKLSQVYRHKEAKEKFGDLVLSNKDHFYFEGNLYIKVMVNNDELYLMVPEVWVLSQRSGSDKTHIRPEKDLVKMGLKNGEMILQTPKELVLDSGYKPSFDTKVILSHAVGNAIVASILAYLYGEKIIFAEKLKNNGLALAHWHGYLNPNFIPKGWHIHGENNPHVACSSPQSAIYAIQGKFNAFIKSEIDKKEYFGDIHIEPHHGSNITFSSIKDLAKFFIKNQGVTSLGNKFLHLYKSNTL